MRSARQFMNLVTITDLPRHARLTRGAGLGENLRCNLVKLTVGKTQPHVSSALTDVQSAGGTQSSEQIPPSKSRGTLTTVIFELSFRMKVFSRQRRGESTFWRRSSVGKGVEGGGHGFLGALVFSGLNQMWGCHCAACGGAAEGEGTGA